MYGFSDEETDSDEYFFDDDPKRRSKYFNFHENLLKNIGNRLQDAVKNDNLKEVEQILDIEQKNVDYKLENGWTALMFACFHAQKRIVDYLLDKGADSNLHGDSVTPVILACSNNTASEDIICDIIASLIDKNCILNVGDRYGQTPMMRAIANGLTKVVEFLLSKDVNIEMRDSLGWTALFYAVHHNQVKILELLISKGARITEVDMNGRNAMEIAESHEYPQIIEILSQFFQTDIEEETLGHDINDLTTWCDYYPGIKSDERPTYSNEIPHLLYGMNCERLSNIMIKNEVDLRTFLLLDDSEMVQLGIEMPYEQQRLKFGLKAFHSRAWKLNTVAGLQLNKGETYSVLECLSVLGSHLQQLYILEATLQYVLRDYSRIHDQIKYEPPDSPVIAKLQAAAKKISTNVNSIRREIKSMKNRLTKISRNNPKPADLIKEKSNKDVVVGYLTSAIIICSLGVLVYNAKNFVTTFIRK